MKLLPNGLSKLFGSLSRWVFPREGLPLMTKIQEKNTHVHGQERALQPRTNHPIGSWRVRVIVAGIMPRATFLMFMTNHL